MHNKKEIFLTFRSFFYYYLMKILFPRFNSFVHSSRNVQVIIEIPGSSRNVQGIIEIQQGLMEDLHVNPESVSKTIT